MSSHISADVAPVAERERWPYSLRAFLLYFLKLGALGFGGPIALAGYMQRDLVEERAWIEKRDYDEGLALAQLSPGPMAAQLAIYIGWVRGKVFGATVVSLAFIGPSFFMIMALSAIYVRFGGIAWMQGAFYGIGAAVIAIIAKSAVGLGKKTLKQDKVLWGIAIANTVATAITEKEAVWLVVLGGLFTLALRGGFRGSALGFVPLPVAWVTGLHGPAGGVTLLKVLTYFATAGIFVFGSGLAIVPFLHGGVVVNNEWLTERQFLDAVAIAMITPGPVVITVAFIGYLVAGPVGAVLASIGVFAPCFVIVLLAAPHYRKLAGNARIKIFVEGVTAGAVGAIAGAVLVLARKSLVDLTTVAIAGGALVLLSRKRKVPEPLLIGVAGLLGVALSYLRA